MRPAAWGGGVCGDPEPEMAVEMAVGDPPHVGDIRGESTLCAVEFVADGDGRTFYNSGQTCSACSSQKLISIGATNSVLVCVSSSNTQRRNAHYMSRIRKTTAVACLAMAPFAALADITAADIATSALVTDPVTVECTLTDGSAATCLEITVKYVPDDLEVGPFCPTTINDAGGIWDWDGDQAGLYRVDGEFLQMLDEMGYHFYDEDGSVHVFDIRVEGPTESNECISGSFDEAVEMTMLIPTTPKMADEPVALGTVAKVGVSLSGVPIFADAPSVLQTGHMPALDACAGHVDPGGWYHYHGTATDLDTVYEETGVQASCANAIQDAKAQFGYAFDGYAIMGSLE
ncbi:MAG: YHYH protein, partial [Octadecabacter sp.]